MRKRITIAVVVVLLSLVLTIPAAASKPVDVAGSLVSEILWDEAWDVGNRCFAVGEAEVTFFDGDFVGTGQHYFWSVGHEPCHAVPGPFQMVETFRQEGTFYDGTVLDKSGTFDYRCQNVWRPDDPDTLMLRCTITSGTGELSGLHGQYEVHLTEWPFSYSGQVHFDGE
jgi:hypothetical protein